VVIVGGAEGRVEIFDPETGSFEPAPELSRSRDHPSVTMLDDGSLLVVGGFGSWSPWGLAAEWTTPRTAEVYHPDRRIGEPSATALSGFTLSLLPDSDWGHSGERAAGELSLLLVVPPGGLQGATYANALWGIASNAPQDFGSVAWVGPDGLTWGIADEVRRLPVDCEQGCEIRETVFDARWAGTWTGLSFHIEYKGDIPREAEGITLTIVDSG
jgi:hypothetical protein